jgi:hypothetical protein
MMNLSTLKTLFLTTVFMLFGCLAIQAADEGLITKQITIKLDKAGTLHNRISSSKKYLITNLKIVGEVNGTDWCLIREMAGSNDNLKKTDGKLSILDLSDAKIVKGGIPYVTASGITDQYTSNDKLGDLAFRGCSGLISLTIPSSVTSIGYSAFEGCSGLTSLSIPSSVTLIESGAFRGCSGLTSLPIPSSVTSIGYRAFEDCTGLTSLAIPSSVTSIGSNAFENCSGLTSITIPSSVTSIGSGAFRGCSGLTSLTIPSSVTSIESDAFEDCTGLPNLYYIIDDEIETYLSKGHPYIGVECGIEYYLNDKKITSVVIPSTITELWNYAFQNCRDLTSVYVSWQIPIPTGSAFYGVDISKCTLYVPQGTEQDYWLSPGWGDFGNIVEYDPTGIDRVTTSTDAKELSRYSVNGQRLSVPAKGLNIVKYSDGSVKKVVVQ